eukprot:gene6647-4766_t
MFSTRGSIATELAMMECASSQSCGGGVFLLSELEKAWASLSILVGKQLLEGHHVQVPHFGAFWLEDHLLVTDKQRRRYVTRKVCFGLHSAVATRYHINTDKVPLVNRSLEYAKVHPAHMVAVCEVPADRIMTALREFFLYIGEGLFRGKVFQLKFPGVATLLLRKEQLVIVPDWELQMGLFNVDARRWPTEMRELCRLTLQEMAVRSTPDGSHTSPSSRPSTTGSRVSLRSAPPPPKPIDPTSVFTSATRPGRLFSEIAKEQARRREEKRQRVAGAAELRGRIQQISSARGPDITPRFYDPEYAPGPVDSGPPRPFSGESIYNVLVDNPPSPQPSWGQCSDDDDVELEVEEVEVDCTGSSSMHMPCEAAPTPAERTENRPLHKKNPVLESVLQQEEAFSRPISRRTYHEHSSVRDLIYSSDAVVGSSAGNANMRFGRKRFDVSQPYVATNALPHPHLVESDKIIRSSCSCVMQCRAATPRETCEPSLHYTAPGPPLNSTIHTAAPAAQGSRFRFERPNSAPLPSSSTPSPPASGAGQASTPFLVASAVSPNPSSLGPQLQRSESEVSDVSMVEERLRIIKRSRISGKAEPIDAASLLPSPSRSSSVGASRLPKHEQHVVDAMITECLDALLFPSAL